MLSFVDQCETKCARLGRYCGGAGRLFTAAGRINRNAEQELQVNGFVSSEARGMAKESIEALASWTFWADCFLKEWDIYCIIFPRFCRTFSSFSIQ